VNPATAVLLALAGAAAAVNWVGVARGDRRLVYAAKPSTLALLVGAAAVLDADDGAVRAWFVAGLALSLVGDVILMLPDDRPTGPNMFLYGLGSFLLGHLAYIAGMGSDHRSWALTLVGAVGVAAALAVIGPRVLAGVSESSPAMRGPVLGYMAVISVMVVTAFGRTVPAGIVGALLFYASDASLAWNRFVRPSPALRLTVIVTYHLAQAALVLALLA